jgi:hypothetical protein
VPFVLFAIPCRTWLEGVSIVGIRRSRAGVDLPDRAKFAEQVEQLLWSDVVAGIESVRVERVGDYRSQVGFVPQVLDEQSSATWLVLAYTGQMCADGYRRGF